MERKKESRRDEVIWVLNGSQEINLSDSPVETISVLKVLLRCQRHLQPSYLCNASALSKLFFFICSTKAKHLETKYLYLLYSQFFGLSFIG